MSDQMLLSITGIAKPAGIPGTSLISVVVDCQYNDREKFTRMLFEVMRDEIKIREQLLAAAALYLSVDPVRAKKFSTTIDLIIRNQGRPGITGKLVDM